MGMDVMPDAIELAICGVGNAVERTRLHERLTGLGAKPGRRSVGRMSGAGCVTADTILACSTPQPM